VQHRTGSQEPESVLSEPPVGRHTPTISWPTPKPACHGLELRCFQAWDGRMGRYGPGNGTGWDGLCQLCTFYRVLPRLSPSKHTPEARDWVSGVAHTLPDGTGPAVSVSYHFS
jgi:hypothetical protein